MSNSSHVPPSRVVAGLAHNPNIRKGVASDRAVKLYLTNSGVGHGVLQHMRAFGYEIASINPRFNMIRCVPTSSSTIAPANRSNAIRYHRLKLRGSEVIG